MLFDKFFQLRTCFRVFSSLIVWCSEAIVVNALDIHVVHDLVSGGHHHKVEGATWMRIQMWGVCCELNMNDKNIHG